YRQIQQPALHYVVDVENPACTSIAIPKRVNRFKLKVGNRDFYQRIDLWVLGVIDKLNQVPRQFLQNSLTSGRRIDRLSGIGTRTALPDIGLGKRLPQPIGIL